MPAAVAVDGTQLHADDVKETAALIFKTTSEAHVGELSFFRVYAGQITSGMDLANPNRSGTERLGHVYSVNGHDRDEVMQKQAQIAALLGSDCRQHDLLFSTRILKKTGLRLVA